MDSQFCTICARKYILLLVKGILECDEFQSCNHDESLHPFIELTEGIFKLNDQNPFNKYKSKDQCDFSSLQFANGEGPGSHEKDSFIASSGLHSDDSNEALYCSENQSSSRIQTSSISKKIINKIKDSLDQSFSTTTIQGDIISGLVEDEKKTHMSTTSRNQYGTLSSTFPKMRSKSVQDFKNNSDDDESYEEYPKRIRRSKYCSIDGDLSHLRRDPKSSKSRDPKSSKSRESKRQGMKETGFSMERSQMIQEKDKPIAKGTEELEDVLIVRELRNYLCNPKSTEHQTFALAILSADRDLMRVFFEEIKK